MKEQEYLSMLGIEDGEEYGIIVEDDIVLFQYKYDTGEPIGFRTAEHGSERNPATVVNLMTMFKPVLFGMQRCKAKDDMLYIFPSEIDAVAGMIAGCMAVGMPVVKKNPYSWVSECWDFLEQYPKICIVHENDEQLNTLRTKLDHHILFELRLPGAADRLIKDKMGLIAALLSAREIPPYGLLELADVVPVDVRKIPKAKSGISALDRAIGGFLYGDLSVWTGRRGEGKSTFLSQVCIEAIEGGHNVCVYSGELSADRFQYWFDLQCAGKNHVQMAQDDGGRPVFYLNDRTRQAIHNWYRGKIKVYDNTIARSGEAESILKAFSEAARRYDSKVFLVDNLMTARYTTGDRDFYRAQSQFVGKLVEFAQKFKVHVHLVAHPRKNDGSLSNDDIAGSGDITNRASNVFSITRLDEDEKKDFGCDSVLNILKNRWDGATAKIGLDYDPESRRFYQPAVGNKREYGWVPVQMRAKITEEAPFDL